ncbi:hypothetical protein ACFL2O_11130 [Thermodesulfobacteriota bacterium]
MYQAASNTEFADESWVGLPIETAQHLAKTNKITEFTEKGIGLLGIGVDGCTVFLKPNTDKSNQNQIIQMHCVERFWRDLQKLETVKH